MAFRLIPAMTQGPERAHAHLAGRVHMQFLDVDGYLDIRFGLARPGMRQNAIRWNEAGQILRGDSGDILVQPLRPAMIVR